MRRLVILAILQGAAGALAVAGPAAPPPVLPGASVQRAELGVEMSGSAVDADDGGSVISLTLARAIERARKVSASLRALDADVRAAEAEVGVARARRRPGVDLSAAYVRRSSVPELALTFPDGSVRVIFPDVRDWWQGRAEASYPLYAGGGLAAAEAAARDETEAAREDRAAGGIDLDLEVTGAYWRLVTARETDRVLAEAMQAYEAHLVDARNRRQVGLAASNEVLAVEVERDRAELNRIRATNAADLATAELIRLLDLPPGQRIEPSDPLASAAVPPLDVESLVREALDTRPERKAIQSRVAATSSRIDVARGARRPQIAISGGWEYANPNSRVLPLNAAWNDTWDVGIGVTFPVFDGGEARSAQAREAARVDGLRQRLEDLDRRIRLDVRSSVLDVRDAAAAIPVAERGVESARESLRVTRERYREGVTPSSELLDAEVALQRAGLNRAESMARLRLALAGLERALGRSS
jgi:outer membrane protein TolC